MWHESNGCSRCCRHGLYWMRRCYELVLLAAGSFLLKCNDAVIFKLGNAGKASSARWRPRLCGHLPSCPVDVAPSEVWLQNVFWNISLDGLQDAALTWAAHRASLFEVDCHPCGPCGQSTVVGYAWYEHLFLQASSIVVLQCWGFCPAICICIVFVSGGASEVKLDQISDVALVGGPLLATIQ